MKYNWLISYDIRDAKRLRKVAKFMEGYGVRLQYSVFKVNGTDRDIEKIRFELSKKIEDSDSVLYFKFCENCSKKIQSYNPETSWNDPDAERNYVIF